MASYLLHSHDGEIFPDTGPAEIIPCCPSTSWEGTPASSSKAESKFLQAMELPDSADFIRLTNKSKVLSSAPTMR